MISTRLRAWLVAAAIFVSGIAVGGAGTAWVGLRVLRHALRAPATAPGFADRAAGRIAAELTSTLKLTPDQSLRVHAILERSAGNLKAIRARAGAEAAAELRDSTTQLVADLPAEKRAEFYRLIARRYERLGLPAPTPEETLKEGVRR